MSDQTPDTSRTERHARARRTRRFATAAIVVAVVAVAAVGGALGWRAFRAAEDAPPTHLVVIAESVLEDETTVAGAIGVIAGPGQGGPAVAGVDTGAKIGIPGTSYDRLRDALPMAGADEVAAGAMTLLGEKSDRIGWIVLDEREFAALIDAAGGVQVDVPEATTVFTGERLFRFKPGPAKLSGGQAVALCMGADVLRSRTAASAVRTQLGEALAAALVSHPDVLASAGRSGVQTSLTPAGLDAFLSSAAR